MRRAALFLICFVLLLAADFALKWHVFHTILPGSFQYGDYPYGGIPLFKTPFGVDFSMHHVHNHGAAWGMFASYQHFLHWFRIAMIAALFYLLLKNKLPTRTLPFVLIIAGALGNVVDYFLYGSVVDMLHVCLWGYHFPTFNIADSAIFVGVSLLLLERKKRVIAPPV